MRRGLYLVAAFLRTCRARRVLYMLSKEDGCGAQAQQAVHLSWIADALGYEAGGMIGDPSRRSHGWPCDALLRGLGLPRTDAFATSGCARAAAGPWRDALADAAIDGAADCVVYEKSNVKIGADFFQGGGGRNASLRSRYLAAQRSAHRLPAPAIGPAAARPAADEKRGRRTIVALHVRRGDVGDAGRFRRRYTPNAWYVALMTKALPRRFGGNLEFHVYSEGPPRDFADLAALGAVLHLDGDPLQAVADFIAADVLVLSKSSFSYVPAVFRDGPVVYQKGGYHAHYPGWIGAHTL